MAGHQLPYESLTEVRKRLTEISPNLTRYGEVEEANYFKQAQQMSQVSSSLVIQVQMFSGNTGENILRAYRWECSQVIQMRIF